MSPILKRTLLIVGLLVVAGLFGLALYFMFRSTVAPTTTVPSTGGVGGVGTLPTAGERTPTTTQGGANQPLGTLPPAGTITPNQPQYYQPEPVTKVSSDYAVFPSLSDTGDLRYHNVLDGKFYRIGADGQPHEMSSQVFYDVQKVTWAKNKNEAVLEYPDNSKIVYNFDAQKQVTLPSHWQDFTFSPDGNQIAAKSLALSPESRYLVVTNDDGTGTQLIEPLGDNADKVTMAWSPSRQVVALSQTGQPLGADRREVLFVGLNHENFKSTIVEGLDFQPQWSPTGKQLLYSVDSTRSDFKPELWIVNSYGDNIGTGRRMLELNTWANKCSFRDDDTLFCAVPRDLPEGAGMSPDIAKDNFDDLYKIDLKTGLKTPIPLGADYHVENISFDTKNNRLLFTDHAQSGVFSVNL